ncbi:MAG: hypothetical protein ACREAD_02035 [Nitrosopumilaceae archaeon]
MMDIYYKSNSGIQSVTIDQWSANLQQGEEFIWSHSEEKGLIHKHLKQLWAITNYRIFNYDAETNQITGLLMMSDLEDPVVMNTHRVSNSTRVGSYSSFSRGFGISSGKSSSKSVTVGDLVFMSGGRPFITWSGITDPNGLKRMVTAIKKELYPKKELAKFLAQTPNLNPIRDKSICLGCGTKNPQGSSFCCKCGQVLR